MNRALTLAAASALVLCLGSTSVLADTSMMDDQGSTPPAKLAVPGPCDKVGGGAKKAKCLANWKNMGMMMKDENMMEQQEKKTENMMKHETKMMDKQMMKMRKKSTRDVRKDARNPWLNSHESTLKPFRFFTSSSAMSSSAMSAMGTSSVMSSAASSH